MAKRILFQGDSITDMGRSREDENYNGVGYPTLVMGRLGYDNPEVYEFRNRGISGRWWILHTRLWFPFQSK